MNQYSQEDKRRRQMKLSGKAAAASKEKRTIIIIVSCILAIILIAGIIALAVGIILSYIGLGLFPVACACCAVVFIAELFL